MGFDGLFDEPPVALELELRNDFEDGLTVVGASPLLIDCEDRPSCSEMAQSKSFFTADSLVQSLETV